MVHVLVLKVVLKVVACWEASTLENTPNVMVWYNET